MKKLFSKVMFFVIVFSILFTLSCGSDSEGEPDAETQWTIMYYGDGDCDLESALLEDIEEMKEGFVDGQGINLIVLFDRISGYSSDNSVFGENFTDTRLYRITSGKVWRLSGGNQFPEISKTSSYEGNMGDAVTLKKFIQFCKAHYPAKQYGLIISNHGGGSRKKSPSASTETFYRYKEISYDETDSGDVLFTGEISDYLSSDESVDLLGLDACLMSSVEFAYQFRYDSTNSGFSAKIMVASAPTETGNGWDYYSILKRLQKLEGDNEELDITLGGSEKYYDPANLTPEILGAIIIEEQRDSTFSDSSQSLTCVDLSKVKDVKEAVDELSIFLYSENKKSDMETLRGVVLL